MKRIIVILFGLMPVFIAGCESDVSKAVAEIAGLRADITQLNRQLEQCKVRNEQLEKQVETLSALKPEIRLENLYHLEKVKLSGYTNLYDKDGDGKKETLIVYIQPIDQQGDVIKAAGSVKVQLWDLDRKEGNALLGEGEMGPSELANQWMDVMMSVNYRLMFDVRSKIEGISNPLTVKVMFTDYLTGKTFEEQKVVKP